MKLALFIALLVTATPLTAQVLDREAVIGRAELASARSLRCRFEQGVVAELDSVPLKIERGQLTFVNDPHRGRQTKGLRSRTVPLSGEVLRDLREHAARFRFIAPASPYVFKHLRRSRDAEPGQRIERVYRGLKAAAKRAKLTDFRPHDLRHSFTTRKLAEGVPAQLVMRYVGHADLATTLRYTHLVPEHLRAVVVPTAARATGGVIT